MSYTLSPRAARLVGIVIIPPAVPVRRKRIILNPNLSRNYFLASRTASLGRTANVLANGRNRSYGYSTVADSLLIEYGPNVFANLRKPRGRARFA